MLQMLILSEDDGSLADLIYRPLAALLRGRISRALTHRQLSVSMMPARLQQLSITTAYAHCRLH